MTALRSVAMRYSEEAALLTITEQLMSVERCCDELVKAARPPADMDVVGQLRMKLAGLLHANLASEEVQINGPFRRMPVSQRPANFAALAMEAADLRLAYSQHVGRWSLAALTADPAGYALGSRNLITAVKSHIVKKRRALPDWIKALAQRQAA